MPTKIIRLYKNKYISGFLCMVCSRSVCLCVHPHIYTLIWHFLLALYSEEHKHLREQNDSYSFVDFPRYIAHSYFICITVYYYLYWTSIASFNHVPDLIKFSSYFSLNEQVIMFNRGTLCFYFIGIYITFLFYSNIILVYNCSLNFESYTKFIIFAEKYIFHNFKLIFSFLGID